MVEAYTTLQSKNSKYPLGRFQPMIREPATKCDWNDMQAQIENPATCFSIDVAGYNSRPAYKNRPTLDKKNEDIAMGLSYFVSSVYN